MEKNNNSNKKEILRLYQEDVLNFSKNNNCICYLDTGSGKTKIAIELIRFFYEKMGNNPTLSGKGYFVFLAPTNVLVHQQYSKIKAQNFEIDVFEIKGNGKMLLFDDKAIEKKLQKIQILVMTPQLFMNLLITNTIDMKCVKLLILDECHHSQNDDTVFHYTTYYLLLLIYLFNFLKY